MGQIEWAMWANEQAVLSSLGGSQSLFSYQILNDNVMNKLPELLKFCTHHMSVLVQGHYTHLPERPPASMANFRVFMATFSESLWPTPQKR